MGCATSLVKFLIFLFNFVFVAGGTALIVFGALIYNGYKTYEEILPDLGLQFQYPPILMMIVGSIVFVIAFMGCCGTIRESKCMMMTYATLLLILLVAEIAIIVGAYYHQAELKDLLKKGMKESIGEYQGNRKVQEAWDTMQSSLECCGVDSYSDWNVNIPQSCCVNRDENCTTGVFSQFDALFSTGKIFQVGCVDQIVKKLNTEYGMYAAAVLAAVELLGAVFGCCLGARFGRKLYHT